MGKGSWMTLRTIKGELRMVALWPFRTKKICAALNRHRFDLNVEEYERAGTLYMTSNALALEKGVDVIYKPYADLYDLWRTQRHIVRGERRESRRLETALPRIRANARLVRVSGAMNAQEREVIIRRLEILSRAYGKPNRAEKKLLASKHFATAARLRQELNRVAPAWLCASQGANRLDQRLADLNGMAPFFTDLGAEVYRVIRRYRSNVNCAWVTYAEAPTSDGSGSSAPLNVTVMRQIVREDIDCFKEMTLRPYCDVADLIVAHLRHLDFSLGDGDGPQAGRRIAEIIRALRRLRMIEHLETRLISPLAFYLDLPRKQREDAVSFRDRYLAKSAKSLDRIRALTTDDLDAEILTAVRTQLDLAVLELNKPKPAILAAKDCLKEASLSLATVRKPVRQTYPHQERLAQAS